MLGLTEAQLLARSRQPVRETDRQRFEALLARRLTGEPVAYLLGEKEFFGRPFVVDRRVLVPRPETEHLVEAALAQRLPPAPRVLDLGTGSGCLAVTLALELPAGLVVATDRSPAALSVAALNARRHGVGQTVRLVASDLASAFDQVGDRQLPFDLVVSNPPYVDPADAQALSAEVREFEPADALFLPEPGDLFLARLLAALAGLRPGTPLILELGLGQAQTLESAARSSPFQVEEIREDYAGIPRAALLRRGPD